MTYKATFLIFSAILAALPTKAEALKLCGNKSQGQIISGYDTDAEKVVLDNKEIKISANGKFTFAFDRDANLNHKLSITDFYGNTKDYELKIEQGKWDIQNLKGVEQKKVTPSKQDDKEINRERTDVRAAQKNNTDYTFWQESFSIPVEGRISGKFGGQRIMNGSKMNPHMGMDIAAPQGSPIKAPADGIVTLSGNNNYFYSGNIVVLDHGHGLYTIYAHLLDTKVKAGEKIKKGYIIGTVGKTGRVTGAHLHWGASLDGTRFDPKSLLEKDDFCIDL